MPRWLHRAEVASSEQKAKCSEEGCKIGILQNVLGMLHVPGNGRAGNLGWELSPGAVSQGAPAAFLPGFLLLPAEASRGKEGIKREGKGSKGEGREDGGRETLALGRRWQVPCRLSAPLSPLPAPEEFLAGGLGAHGVQSALPRLRACHPQVFEPLRELR